MSSPKRTRKARKTELQKKITQFVAARSLEGKAHRALDVVDTWKSDPYRDAIGHFIATLVLRRGPLPNRLIMAGKGLLRYTGPRVLRVPKSRRRRRSRQARRKGVTAREAGFTQVS